MELLFLQESLLINICHLLQEAVMTSFLRECPNAVNISLWLHILRYLGLWSVLLWHRHSGWCTQHPLTAASFTSFMLCLTSPQIYTRITDTRKYLILKLSSANTNHLQSNPVVFLEMIIATFREIKRSKLELSKA